MTEEIIIIIIIIMSRPQHGSTWPSLATRLYRPSLPLVEIKGKEERKREREK